MPLAGLHDNLDPWQRIQIKEEAEVRIRFSVFLLLATIFIFFKYVLLVREIILYFSFEFFT